MRLGERRIGKRFDAPYRKRATPKERTTVTTYTVSMLDIACRGMPLPLGDWLAVIAELDDTSCTDMASYEGSPED